MNVSFEDYHKPIEIRYPLVWLNGKIYGIILNRSETSLEVKRTSKDKQINGQIEYYTLN